MAYKEFAKVYDSFMDNVPYDKWFDIILNTFRESNVKDGARVLDAGCGTGKMSSRLAGEGYSVIGIDISDEMLDEARRRTKGSGPNSSGTSAIRVAARSRIEYREADIRCFMLNEKCDAAISICDTMNYMLDEDDMRSALKSLYNALNAGGVLIFDLKSEEFYESLGEATFTDENEYGTYIWDNIYEKDERNNYYYLTFFIDNGKGLFRKYTEEQVQHVFYPDEIKAFLKDAGFRDVRLTECEERTFYTAVKEDQ